MRMRAEVGGKRGNKLLVFKSGKVIFQLHDLG